MISLPDAIEFTVPGNPVPAQRARTMRGGWSFTPKRTVDAEAAVAATYRHVAKGRWFDGPVYLLCWFYLGDRRAKDLDNLAKTVLDGLTKGHAWNDDSQVKALEAYAHYDKANPRTVVRIEAMATETYGNGRLTSEPFVPKKKRAKKNPLPKRGAKR